MKKIIVTDQYSEEDFGPLTYLTFLIETEGAERYVGTWLMAVVTRYNGVTIGRGECNDTVAYVACIGGHKVAGINLSRIPYGMVL